MLEQLQIIFEKGGVMMFPLAVCSFLVLMITLERIFILRKRRLVSADDFNYWRERFKNGNEAKPTDGNNDSILSNILTPLADCFSSQNNRLEERIGDLARKEKHKLERGMVLLDTISGIAPLFGLLGTALGMVDVFSKLSVLGEAKMEALSSGIAEALFTTVTGLFIGIPALVAYNLLSRRIDGILITVEEYLNRIVDEFGNRAIDAEESPNSL